MISRIRAPVKCVERIPCPLLLRTVSQAAARAGSAADRGYVLEACGPYLHRCAELQISRDLRAKAEAGDLVQEGPQRG